MVLTVHIAALVCFKNHYNQTIFSIEPTFINIGGSIYIIEMDLKFNNGINKKK